MADKSLELQPKKFCQGQCNNHLIAGRSYSISQVNCDEPYTKRSLKEISAAFAGQGSLSRVQVPCQQYRTPEEYEAGTDEFFRQEKKWQKPETMFTHPRMMPFLNGCRWNRKYNQDKVRYYDQRSIGFFINNILATKKISIPLR